jgi:1,2-phenylacetyl-CoA epoxidase catalytic subunit
MQAIQREWLRRVEAEYGSAVLTHQLTAWLLQLTAPFELTRLGLAIVEDELAHAELSQEVYAEAGGRSGLQLERERLGMKSLSVAQVELGVARLALDAFCLGETVAVRLFARLRHGCEEPVAQRALDRILKDEVKHREFGWTLLEWLLTTERSGDVLVLARAELPQMFGRLRASYAHTQLNRASPEDALARRWGLMPAPDYAMALHETLERDYVPRFRDHGIDARAAWGAASDFH